MHGAERESGHTWSAAQRLKSWTVLRRKTALILRAPAGAKKPRYKVQDKYRERDDADDAPPPRSAELGDDGKPKLDAKGRPIIKLRDGW